VYVIALRRDVGIFLIGFYEQQYLIITQIFIEKLACPQPGGAAARFAPPQGYIQYK